MFISKKRPIVIPQHEHGRMAGILASIWGNLDFDLPALNFEAFMMGVALHDWGYGLTDNLPIGDTSEADWLEVTRKGLRKTFEHPVTDIIVKLHLRRLLGFKQSETREKMIAELDETIGRRLSDSEHSLREFEWADRITNLCDFIAFYFAFEQPFDKIFAVSPRRQTDERKNIQVVYDGNNEINIQPWPFCLPEYQGFIYGYRQEDYPDVLRPVLLPFKLCHLSITAV